MIHYTYRIDNLINGKYYIGKHSSESLDDDYMGSGPLIKAAIAKYGIENFKKTILKTFPTSEEAFEHEAQIVTMVEVNDPMCYNIQPGGKGKQKLFTDEEAYERALERQREYYQRSKEHWKEYCQRPEVKERKRGYNQRPEVKERQKEHYQQNKERILERRREYYQRSEVKERQKEYYQQNRESRLEYLKEYRQRPGAKERQREYMREYMREYQKERRLKKHEQKKKNEANENNIIFL